MKTYHDPLHINWSALVVPYSKSGAEEIILSKAFIDRQNAWLNLDKIKEAYLLKYVIYDVIEETTDKKQLKSLVADLTEVEFEIQELFGFERNAWYHRFWMTPGCQCPRLDNEENFGTKYSIIAEDCPLHGVE